VAISPRKKRKMVIRLCFVVAFGTPHVGGVFWSQLWFFLRLRAGREYEKIGLTCILDTVDSCQRPNPSDSGSYVSPTERLCVVKYIDIPSPRCTRKIR